MARYRVLIYDKRLGAVGDIVDLAPDLAAWYSRDRACAVVEPIVEARTIDAPPSDRMVRKVSKRKRGES